MEINKKSLDINEIILKKRGYFSDDDILNKNLFKLELKGQIKSEDHK
jgi:hypothetical protein